MDTSESSVSRYANNNSSREGCDILNTQEPRLNQTCSYWLKKCFKCSKFCSLSGAEKETVGGRANNTDWVVFSPWLRPLRFDGHLSFTGKETSWWGSRLQKVKTCRARSNSPLLLHIFHIFFFPPVVAEIICCGRTNFSFSAAGTNRKKKEPKQVNTFLSGDSLRSGWNYCLLTYFQISEYWLYSARSLPNPGTKCESGLSLALLR